MANKKNDDEIAEYEEKRYNISFKKKRTKENIRLGAKLIVYLIIAAISGAVFYRNVIGMKYDSAFSEMEEFVSNTRIRTDYTKVINRDRKSAV